MLESVGASAKKAITYNTNYLLVGDIGKFATTSELKQVQKLGIEMITQSEFEEFIEAKAFPEN